MKINKEAFDFLKKLAKNNNREWFAKNKADFDAINKDIKVFGALLHEELAKSDHIESHHVHRIYRDVRFSKDKRPYKGHLSLFLRRATASKRGGYFMRMEPGKTFVGGGFYAPEKDDLLRIRQEFVIDDTEIRKIVKNKTFKEYFGTVQGDELKTAPRGFEKDHKAIDLIRKKSFYVFREFTDAEVHADSFSEEVVKTFVALRPFFDYMSEVLTTDMNGESLL